MGLIMLLVVKEHPAPLPPARPASPVAVSAAIIDLAPGVQDVASVIRLAPGERVVAVDGQRVESDLAAGAAIAQRPRGRGRYVDLTVAAGGELRRVLVVMH